MQSMRHKTLQPQSRIKVRSIGYGNLASCSCKDKHVRFPEYFRCVFGGSDVDDATFER